METTIKIILFLFLIILIILVFLFLLKKHKKISQEREIKSKRLHEINNKLLASNSLDEIVNLALEYIVTYSNYTLIFYTQDPQSGGVGILKNCNVNIEKMLTSFHEKFLVHWVFENKRSAGVATDFNGKSSCHYIPLISHQNVWGVLGIYCKNHQSLLENELLFLNLILSQVAMAIERQYLSNHQHQMIIETETEKMRANLLRAVSHDLRTPLTVMIGAASTLIEGKENLTEEKQKELLQNIVDDSTWLLHMVENLLSITRINQCGATVNKQPEPLEEVVGEAIMRFKKEFPDAKLTVKIPDDFLMIPMDATLIEQAILNICENAVKYSETNTPIDLLVTKEKDSVLFQITDNGIGLPKDKINTLFEGHDSATGMGIGLSICKTIINAHGGVIHASNRPEGGAVFTFTLPL